MLCTGQLNQNIIVSLFNKHNFFLFIPFKGWNLLNEFLIILRFSFPIFLDFFHHIFEFSSSFDLNIFTSRNAKMVSPYNWCIAPKLKFIQICNIKWFIPFDNTVFYVYDSSHLIILYFMLFHWLIDWLIDFNSMSTRLKLFYTQTLGISLIVHSYLYFLCYFFRVFSAHGPIKYK